MLKLSTHDLLPGNTNNEIETLRTAADKASYFLRTVIKPALDISDTSSFENLLSLMENYSYAHVKKLSCTIKSEMDKTTNTEQDMYV